MQTLRHLVRVGLLTVALGVLGLLLTGPAGAALILNERVPTSGVFSNDCPPDPELVAFEGVFHNMFNLSEDSSGGIHGTSHFNAQRLHGVGLESGDKYSISNATNSGAYLPAGELRRATFVSVFGLVRQGADDNLRVHVTFHITINANGEVTSEFESIRGECLG